MSQTVLTQRGLNAETSYPHVMNALGGPSAPKHTFLVFYSNVVNGKMWCPVSLQVVFPVCVAATMSSQSDSQDCVKVEDTVNKAFEGKDQPSKLALRAERAQNLDHTQKR